MQLASLEPRPARSSHIKRPCTQSPENFRAVLCCVHDCKFSVDLIVNRGHGGFVLTLVPPGPASSPLSYSVVLGLYFSVLYLL